MPQPICTATKGDGQPCKLRAMRGCEQCTAHQTGDVPPKTAMASRVRCTARKTSGDAPCARWALTGQTVCGSHGGNAPQAKAAARDRLLDMVLPAMTKLRLIIDAPGTADGDRLRAIQLVLDRTGFSGKTEISLDVKPWEKLVEGILVEAPDAPAIAPIPDEVAEEQARQDQAVLDSIPNAEVVSLPVPKPKVAVAKVPRHVLDRLA